MEGNLVEKAEQEDAYVLNSYKVTIKIQGGTSTVSYTHLCGQPYKLAIQSK